jgi:beta-1,2-mannobiose phosphorylase / 1,2-beta-oligomannan phosphorylase
LRPDEAEVIGLGIDGEELLVRVPTNPVLTAAMWPYQINTVFNPAAAIHNGETVLICRIEDRRGISQLSVARSADGRTNWRIEKEPLIRDVSSDPTTCWGVEDARVTYVDELGTWVIAYTGYGPDGPSVRLALTSDFQTVEHIGVVMPPEDKNASLLPRRVGGTFVMYHRPFSGRSGRADIWLSRSEDLRSWSQPEPVMASRQGAWWDSTRIGMGPPPIETPYGWFGIYHGVKQMVNLWIYRVGLVLLDLDNPARVLHRTDEWLLGPATDYELQGDVPNVVFPTGMVLDEATDELRIYYGAADTSVALVTGRFSRLLEHARRAPEPPPLDALHL